MEDLKETRRKQVRNCLGLPLFPLYSITNT